MMEDQAGIPFSIDGREGSFIGVLNSHRFGGKLGVGGYLEDVDAILMGNKIQFGETPPQRNQRLTVGGRRYVVDTIEEDYSTYSLILTGINK